jgi:small subunit ribosomal protein S6
MAETKRVAKAKGKKPEVVNVMENYEFMVILKPLLPEDVRGKLMKSMSDLVASLNGTLEIKDNNWGKKHLAYKIKGHEEGYYVLYKMVLAPSAVINFKSALRLMPDVLRFIILKESEL